MEGFHSVEGNLGFGLAVSDRQAAFARRAHDGPWAGRRNVESQDSESLSSWPCWDRLHEFHRQLGFHMSQFRNR